MARRANRPLLGAARRFRRFLVASALTLAAIGAAGCRRDPPARPTPSPSGARVTQPGDAGGKAGTSTGSAAVRYELPTTYAAGVRRVKVLRDQLRAGWRENRHDDVHEPLHELAPLLRELPRLADREEFDDEVRRERVRAIHELFEMFSSIDSGLHSGFGATYDSLESSIDERIARLE